MDGLFQYTSAQPLILMAISLSRTFHPYTQELLFLSILINLMKLLTTLLLFLALTTILAQKSKIRKLSESNLEAFSKDNSYWLIQIAEGRCPQCAAQEQELEQLAQILDGAVKVGKIDAKLIPTLKIEKSPTYIFTRSDEPQNSKPFQGKFGKKEITDFCLEELANIFKRRDGKTQSSQGSQGSQDSGSSGKSSSRSKPSSSSSQSSSGSTTVIELNDKVFEQKVLKSDDAWLVEFYSPGCGHCRNFEPEYNKIPKLIGKRVHISRIDGSKNQQFMGKYQVKGFPTVLLFDTENKGEPIPYNGERTAQAVVDWLKTQNINEQKKQIMQLTKPTYIQECNKNIICLIFILEKKSDRQKLNWLQDVLEEQSSRPVKFFFSDRLEQLENELLISDRTGPKMVSIWDSLNSYRIFNGELTQQSLTTFLKTVLQRRGWIKSQTKLASSLFPSSDL